MNPSSRRGRRPEPRLAGGRPQVTADGGQAGTATLAYIPAGRLAAWYPHGAWDWLRLVKGITSLPRNPTSPGAEEELERQDIFLWPPDDSRNPVSDLLRRVDFRFGKSWQAFVGTLQMLRDIGIAIAMHDSGTGHSTLSHLRRFPFDRIKIAQSYVRDLGEREDGIALSRAVTALGRRGHRRGRGDAPAFRRA